MKKTSIGSIAKTALLAGLTTLAACGSSPGGVYDGTQIQVRARQTQLETDVSMVSDEYRDLRDRFDVLERLYVDLARSIGTQNQSVQELSAKFEDVRLDPRMQNELSEARTRIAVLTNELAAMKDRLVSVERTSNAGPYETIQTIKTRPMNEDGSANAAAGRSSQPVTAPTEAPKLQPQPAAMAPAGPTYALHLASLRQASQATNSLQSLRSTYPAVMENLDARLYRQTQGGLAIFRLLVGPFEEESKAEEACATLRTVQADQYCRVTVFEGEPIEGGL